MKANRIALAGAAAALLATGCKGDPGPFLAVKGPLAYVRYIAAVPDTFATDWRPIDGVENSPPAIGLVFRGTTPYQAMTPGARHIRLFPAPTGVARPADVVSQVIVDTTINFTANTYYTVIHLGLSRTGATPADRLVVLEDVAPASLAGKVAVRVVHAGTGIGAVDVFATTTSTAAVAGSPSFTNVQYGNSSAYVLMDPGTLWLRVAPTGTITPEIITGTSRQAPPGAAGNPDSLLTPIGGAARAGSAMTAFILPRSVAGSLAPQTTAFLTPVLLYLIDKHPPQ
jgi:hypothetical protein